MKPSDPRIDDAERSVIGAVFLQNRALERLTLRPDDFLDLRRRTIWHAVLELERDEKPIDSVTLGAQLNGRGELAVLGELSTCIAVVPTVDNVEFYAEIVLEESRSRRVAERLVEIGRDHTLSADEMLARTRRLLDVLERKAEPDRGAFARWATIDPRYLVTIPPSRRWILRHPTRDGCPVPDREGDGLLPLGKVGILASEGGAGKTNVIIALAISLITGRPWLGHFHVDRQAEDRMVFLGLAEEDQEEIHRRLYNIAQLYQLTPAERALVSDRLVALPLAGEGVALVGYGTDGRTLIDSPSLIALRERLNASARPWSLVVLDPLVRWAGPDVEKDNSVATRFVQALETLTQVKGNPTCLVPHHSSKISRRNGGAVDSRGVTGLTDGVRWVSTIRVESADAWFAQTKSNYSRPMLDEIHLTRDEGGLLRAMTDGERADVERRGEDKAEEREARRVATIDAKISAMMAAILAALREASVPPTSRDALAGLVTGTDTIKVAAVSRLLSTKKIVRVPAAAKGDRAFFRAVYGKDDDEI